MLCGAFFLSFTVYAVYNNILSNAAPVIMKHFGITESMHGLIITMQAVGGLAVGVFISFFGERFNKIKGVACGILMLGLTALLFYFSPQSSYLFLLVCAIMGGVSTFIADILINGALPEVFAENSSTVVPLGHALYSVGAMLTPLAVTAIINPEITSSYSKPYIIVVILGAVVGTSLLLINRKAVEYTPYRDMTVLKNRSVSNPAEIFKNKKAWMIIAISFFYFSFEMGYINWTPTYAQTVMGMSFEQSGRLMSAIFLGNLIMRFVAPGLFKKLKPRTVFLILWPLALVSAAVCFIFKNATLGFILLPLMAFCTGMSAPGLILISTGVFPTRTGAASSAVLNSINVSSLMVPYIIGLLTEKLGFSISIFTIILGLAIAIILMYTFKNQSPDVGTEEHNA